MEHLKELVRVVNRNKVKNLRILDSALPSDRVKIFYKKIAAEEFQNDDEAAEFFFNSDANNTQYRKLKAKLRDLLHNTAFFIDVNNPKFSDAQKAFYQCHKNLVSVRILLGRNARVAAIKLAKQTLSQSRRYDFTEISLTLCQILREHSAFKSGSRSDFKRYDQLVLHFQQIAQAEDQAARCFQMIALDKVKRAAAKLENEEFHREFRNLEKVRPEHRSFRFILTRYLILLNQARSERNYQKLLTTSQDAINSLSKNKTTPAQFLGQFHFNRLLAFAQLGNFKEGKIAAKKSFDIFEKGTIGWFNTMELYFTLLVKSKKYQEAANLVLHVTQEPSYDFQIQKIKELWKKNEAYIYYLKCIGKLPKDDVRKFRLPKFLNEVPVFSMDKQGYNIPILIIQILILIHEKKYEQLTDRIEAIEKYTTRYLTKNENLRSNCFIKMLLQIPRRHFHREAVIRHSKKYVKILQENSSLDTKQPYDIEVIPYEHLWDYTLESLDNKFH